MKRHFCTTSNQFDVRTMVVRGVQVETGMDRNRENDSRRTGGRTAENSNFLARLHLFVGNSLQISQTDVKTSCVLEFPDVLIDKNEREEQRARIRRVSRWSRGDCGNEERAESR